YRGGARRLAQIAAPHDPAEFFWKPARLWPWPYGQHAATRSDDRWIRVERCHAAEPIRLGDGIIVQERDNSSLRDTHARIARGGKAAASIVGDGPYVGACACYQLLQSRVVIDDNDDLKRLKVLSAKRIERGPKAIPSLLGIRTDDNRDRDLLHHSPGIEGECTTFAC